MKKDLKPYFTAANKKTQGKPEMLGLPSKKDIEKKKNSMEEFFYKMGKKK